MGKASVRFGGFVLGSGIDRDIVRGDASSNARVWGGRGPQGSWARPSSRSDFAGDLGFTVLAKPEWRL